MPLDQQVKQYYFAHFDKLAPDKQFHYASRIAAWDGDSCAYDKLRELKEYILPTEYKNDLAGLMKMILATPQTGKRNAHELRQPYFQKYPELYGLHLALFRARHLKAVYGIDAAASLDEVFGKDHLSTLITHLMADKEAVKFLSTFAVNTIYLYDILFAAQMADPKHFIEVAKSYDLKDKSQIQLLIYLYTHCIIGESSFYTQKIPKNKLEVYTSMLAELEKIIGDNFELINLDNKLEFLVCAQICSFNSNLEARIFEECADSISPQGTFLIDVHNQNMQLERQSFAASEHRNVLFIMANLAYQPHSTLV